MVGKIKKQKAIKTFIKRKLKFENYKNCLEATQHDNEINQIKKKKKKKNLMQIVMKNS